MKAIELAAMQAHCDKLTEDGKELTITWEGGNDNGWLFLRKDGFELDPTPENNAVLQYLEGHLGYGSFAGDFSTEGCVVYDRDKKCFIGEDVYTDTDEATTKCEIEFAIPEDIWFESIVLQLDSDGSCIYCSLQLVIPNGPHPEHFESIQQEQELHLQEKFSDLADTLPDFDGAWHTYRIPRRTFVAKDGKLHHQISEMNYSCIKNQVTGIHLSFNEKEDTPN